MSGSLNSDDYQRVLNEVRTAMLGVNQTVSQAMQELSKALIHMSQRNSNDNARRNIEQSLIHGKTQPGSLDKMVVAALDNQLSQDYSRIAQSKLNSSASNDRTLDKGDDEDYTPKFHR